MMVVYLQFSVDEVGKIIDYILMFGLKIDDIVNSFLFVGLIIFDDYFIKKVGGKYILMVLYLD